MTATLTPGSTNCQPRFGTPRDESFPTHGPAVAAIAERLGRPLMPWQRDAADVAYEYDPVTGLFRYDEVDITVPRQSGKALSVDTEVLTQRGFVRMGDIEVGDSVYHPGGYLTEVIATSPVMFDHRCYRMTTTDGRSVIADADHLWTVTDKVRARSVGPRGKQVRYYETVTISTAEMVAAGVSRYRSGGRTTTTDGVRYATNEYRFVLPTQEPLKDGEPADLPIDPYLFGAWLGDGTSAHATLTCSYGDMAHWEAAIESAGFVPTKRVSRHCGSIGISTYAGPGRFERSFGGHLRRLGVLNNKHVPDLYLTASAQQREALLQGLMDTDGTVGRARGQATFCSTKRELADAVLFLARSLGWRSTLRISRAKLDGRDCGPKYDVYFTPKQTDPFSPFRMERKRALVGAVDGGKGRHTVSISSIAPVESVPVRCIKVAAPDGLFLAGRDLIATHNTTLTLAKKVFRCTAAARTLGPQRSTYTAQKRLNARRKLERDFAELLRGSRSFREITNAKARPTKATEWRLSLNNGSEAIQFGTGSFLQIDTPSRTGGHGDTLDDGTIDEAFAHEDDTVEAGMRPAMATRKNAQIWVISTAGDGRSKYLYRKVLAGRAATDANHHGNVCYIEYSAPEDADPGDPATWWGCMPALGSTVTEDFVQGEWDRAQRKGQEGINMFLRAYLNLWPDVPNLGDEDSGGAFPGVSWSSLADPDAERGSRVSFGVATNPDRTKAAIAVAWRRPDGAVQVMLAKYDDSTDWVTAETTRLRSEWGGQVRAAKAALDLVPGATDEQQSRADNYLADLVAAGNLRHGNQPALNIAVRSSQWRPSGDSRVLNQRGSTDISPLIAAAQAVYGLKASANAGRGRVVALS